MDDFNDKKALLSEFNEAVFQIHRLHNIWQLSNNYARKGQLQEWRWILDRAWVELATDAKEKDEKKYFSEMKQLDDRIAKAKTDGELYPALKEKEIFLRVLQNAVGKGSKKTGAYEHM